MKFPNRRHLLQLLATAALFGGGGTAAVVASADNGSPGHQPEGICHHTGNSQAHEWIYITPDASGVAAGHANDNHQNFFGPEDIIKGFTYTDAHGVTHTVADQNLTTKYNSSLEPDPNGQFTGAEILANYCLAPSGTTTGQTTTGETTTGETTTGSTTTVTTPVTTTVTTPGTTTTVPSTTTVTTPGQTNTVTTPGATQTVTVPGPTQTTTVTTPGPTQTVTTTVTVKTPGKTRVVIKKKVIVHVKKVTVKPKHHKPAQPSVPQANTA